MGQRAINLYSIAGRRDIQEDYAAPDDLQLTLDADVAPDPMPDRVLPYCADMMRERVLFTCHDPAGFAGTLSAPFMFVEQLRSAAGVVSVPFERLQELAAPAGAPPVLIFSPGRTGSTLLAKLLACAGHGCISEPDMPTQLARLPDEAFALLPQGTRGDLARACFASLARALGGGAFIKLRSQCNAAPLLLTQAAHSARVVFLLRGLRAWALSRHRSFLEPPWCVAAVLREAMDALDKLAFSGAALSLVWYEDLVADPCAALRALAPGCAPDPALVASVMARDSQEDTPVARALVAAMPADDDFWDGFMAAWGEARAGAEWTGWTQGVLRAMWEKDALRS